MPRPYSVDTLSPGQQIGPFVLLAPLGAGGSGRVWAVARGGQLGFAKRMALKVMRQDKLGSSRARQRFDREACIAAQLDHPNLRAVHDLGSHDGRPYMAMSWVDTSLAELLEHAPGKRLEPEVVCWLGIQCCAALSAAHAHAAATGPAPIVHRDVSPGNILLSVDGHALLADLTAPVHDASLTPPEDTTPDTGFFGSLGYAAPEAVREQALDGRADLFSLGCVLYEAVAGAPPFEGDDERSVMFQVLEQDPPDLASRAPDAPAALVKVVRRALQRPVEQRFQSAAEMSAALSACVRQHSAFTLEERTAAVIREVLGARIVAREEAMHLAFQRFATSQLERTDTLPISTFSAGSSPPPLVRPDPGARASRPRPAASPSPAASERPGARLQRRLLLVAALLALLGGGYGLCMPGSEPGVQGPAPQPRGEPAPAGGLRGQAEAPPPPDSVASVGAGDGPAPARASSGDDAAGAPRDREAAPASATSPPAIRGDGPRQRTADERSIQSVRRALSPEATPRKRPAVKALPPAAPRPFVFSFEGGNPYEEAGPPPAATPSAPSKPPGDSQ